MAAQESNRSKGMWARPFAALAALGMAVFATAAVLLGGSGVAPESAGTPAVVGPADVRLVADEVPDNARRTLELIDAGQWPDAAGAPGTQGGGTWNNREGQLPATDGSGNKIRYQEWDVNPKQEGQSRDAERIVTGSDGSAWYTGDHYRSFTRMR
ncbi:ribonuclease domain-containing protein [Nocardia sp. BMG51109]|uniref:ribonuclease domain-containing protein n=1 Tax=Nocardia sp. BMG51109 TaxID=1056816 RepID=UPI001E5E757E|nr:ribonuclease domain-containing protein [Nocardia sp. BMG51109]